MSKIKAHLVTYTHWDREFRTDYESTRVRLVKLMDNLLEIMESNPEYKSYLLDGQFTLVDDYLEIKPEKKDLIMKLVKDNRLEIGPWYTLCDCAPVNGESVIRNLEYGLMRCEEYGGAMKVGYNVFSFGQIAQLPQIYRGFDIDSVIFYKYMNPERTKYHEFYWEGQDGSRVLASKLGKEARWNFFFAAHVPIVYNLDVSHKDWQYKWGTLGKVFHMVEPESYGSFFEILEPETTFHPEAVKWGMERVMKTVEGTAAPENVLFFDGTDFTEPHPCTPEYVKEINKQMGDEIEVVHSTLSAYIEDLKKVIDKKNDLSIVKGAMRDGPLGSVHTDSFSMHPEILQENSKAENAIIRWVEPYYAMASALGVEYPKGYLEYVWKILFTCHAHDSIQGVGPGPLAKGVYDRLERANIVLEELNRTALQAIATKIDTSKDSETDYFLAVFNNSSFIKSGVVEAYVDVPRGANVDELIIKDSNGKVVEIQELGYWETRGGIYHPRSRNMPFYAVRYHIIMKVDSIPALGYSVYNITWTEKNTYPYPHEEWDPIRIPANDLMTSSTSAENEFIKIDFNFNGTFNLEYKKTGKEYKNLNYIHDSRDKGNTAVHVSPGIDKIVTSLQNNAKVSIKEHGPLRVVFNVETTIEAPLCYDFVKQLPSAETRIMPVESEIIIKKGSPYVEVTTSVDSQVKDHFMRVCFPTELDAKFTHAEGSFMVTEYPIEIPDKNGLKGDDLTRHASQLFFDVSNGTEGLAILNDAARDYEVFEDDKQTIAMSIIRGVRTRIACDNRLWMEYPGDEGSQGMKKHTLHYAICPHDGNWEEGNLYKEALSFSNPLRIAEIGKQEGSLPVEKSFLSIDDKDLVLSAIKKSSISDNLIIRVFNPTESKKTATINFGIDILKAYNVKLSEERIEEISIKNNTVKVSVIPGQIYTLELEV